MFIRSLFIFGVFAVPFISRAGQSIGLVGPVSPDNICVAALMDWDGHDWKSAAGTSAKPAPDDHKWNEFYDGKAFGRSKLRNTEINFVCPRKQTRLQSRDSESFRKHTLRC